MEDFNPAPGEFERVERPGVAGFYRRVASISARSPRAATSSTMARVALSISADTSRFIARKSANRWAKSALLLSSRTGMLAFRRWASLEGLLLNGAATNRRQPFRLRIKLMMAERVFRHSGMVRRTRHGI